MNEEEKKIRLVLIDGHAVVFRAFYAYPGLTTPMGELVNAVYGFASILLNVVSELAPTHIAVAFDVSAPTFRHTDFADYKAQRKETPSELKDQLDRVKEVVTAMNMPIFEVEGYEADDVIGTLALQASKLDVGGECVETVIVTGDKDSFQLVSDGQEDGCPGPVKVWIPGRRSNLPVMYDEERVAEKMGIRVDQVVDLKGLAGDSSDNIPGIRGIGPKTAVNVLKEFETIDGFYEALKEPGEELEDRVKKAGIGKAALKKLVEGYEIAKKSQMLATIVRDVPIDLDMEACRVHDYDKDKIVTLFNELGFKSLVKKLPKDEFEKGLQEALF